MTKIKRKPTTMAEPVLKFPPEQKGNPPEETPAPKAGARNRLLAGLRRYRRTLLLVVLPLVALIGGFAFYLGGGRYVTTDDAYVGAQKVLITPDISGKILKVVVREGQLVNPGDVLFEIDPVPFQLALEQAKAKLGEAKSSYDTLRSNLASYAQSSALSKESIAIKQRDVDRKTTLVKSNFGSQLDLDTSMSNVVQAQALNQILQQQIASAKNQLLGNPDLPLEQFPAYAQAKAVLDDAQRNLDHTVVRAPMGGVATQVDSIQLGRFVMAGTPVFSVINISAPWVDANPKESDFTYVAVGQPVRIDVDAFPDHVFKGSVGSLSPGTGAQFAILPPQNATGNFVKVVQRVPVRIYFDATDGAVQKLKAGMSVFVSIDTGHKRTLAGIFGLGPTAVPAH